MTQLVFVVREAYIFALNIKRIFGENTPPIRYRKTRVFPWNTRVCVGLEDIPKMLIILLQVCYTCNYKNIANIWYILVFSDHQDDIVLDFI